MKLFGIALILTLGGLLAWGNWLAIDHFNDAHEQRMAENYQINVYEGKLLLTQNEYSELKTYLVKPEVSIKEMKTYESNDVLIDYWITAPADIEIPFVGEAERQYWRYEKGRAFDYVGYGFMGIFSLLVWGLISSIIHKIRT